MLHAWWKPQQCHGGGMAQGVIISALILIIMVHPSLNRQPNSITISVVYLRATTNKNKAKFVELPLDELEKSYDPQWLKERVVACRTLTWKPEHRFFGCELQLISFPIKAKRGGHTHRTDQVTVLRFVVVNKVDIADPKISCRTRRTKGNESIAFFTASRMWNLRWRRQVTLWVGRPKSVGIRR